MCTVLVCTGILPARQKSKYTIMSRFIRNPDLYANIAAPMLVGKPTRNADGTWEWGMTEEQANERRQRADGRAFQTASTLRQEAEHELDAQPAAVQRRKASVTFDRRFSGVNMDPIIREKMRINRSKLTYLQEERKEMLRVAAIHDEAERREREAEAARLAEEARAAAEAEAARAAAEAAEAEVAAAAKIEAERKRKVAARYRPQPIPQYQGLSSADMPSVGSLDAAVSEDLENWAFGLRTQPLQQQEQQENGVNTQQLAGAYLSEQDNTHQSKFSAPRAGGSQGGPSQQAGPHRGPVYHTRKASNFPEVQGALARINQY